MWWIACPWRCRAVGRLLPRSVPCRFRPPFGNCSIDRVRRFHLRAALSRHRHPANYPDKYRRRGPLRTVDRLGFCRNRFVRPVGLQSPMYCRHPSASPAVRKGLAADWMTGQWRLTVASPERRPRRPRWAGTARRLRPRVVLSFLHLFIINGLHGSRALGPWLAPAEKNVALWVHPARSGIFCTSLYPRVGRTAVCFHPGSRVGCLCRGVFLGRGLRRLRCALRMRSAGHDKQHDSGCDYQWRFHVGSFIYVEFSIRAIRYSRRARVRAGSAHHDEQPLRVHSTNAPRRCCHIYSWSGEGPSQRTCVGGGQQRSAKDVGTVIGRSRWHAGSRSMESTLTEVSRLIVRRQPASFGQAPDPWPAGRRAWSLYPPAWRWVRYGAADWNAQADDWCISVP